MGLLKGVVSLPLAPLSGLRWLAEVLAEEAERGRAAEQSPERALAELAARRANGEISDGDADALEYQLVEELLSRRSPAAGA
ncbi:MAG: hypothetical protein QOE80_130 [Actinomycetota bacterium]|jgi:hypothetical protein|nr:hypothetical protein [Actinomycetota bacterium]